MRIVVVGAGYVGLVSGACLSELGHHVTCVDVDSGKIDGLLAGRVPIYEPGLAELIAADRQAGRLEFTTDLGAALMGAEAVLLAVGTPPRVRDGEADLTFVYAAAAEVIRAASAPLVIITKSTVPVGTGDVIERMARKTRPELEIGVASNPEFLREGSAMHDFRRPDRIVVGSNDERSAQVLRGIYARQVDSGVPLVETARKTAELIKYAANAFLAVKISFANEMADLCEALGSDADQVAKAMGYDRRIGPDFLKAGPGYGGSCFPKDTMALLRTAQDNGVSLRLVQETVATNDARKRKMGRKVIESLGGDVRGKKIAILGLAFKANTDDVRESPAIPLVESLQRAGAIVSVYDPHAMPNARKILEDVIFAPDALCCVNGAEATVLATDWPEFRDLDLHAVRRLMASNVLVDLRNAFDLEVAEELGFVHVGVGRAVSQADSSLAMPRGRPERPALALAKAS